MTQPTLRFAEPRDCTAVLDCIRHMIDEFAINMPPVEDVPALTWILEVIGMGFALVAEADGKVVGSLGMTPMQVRWNSRDWMMRECWYYVDPAYRRGARIGASLIRAAQKKSDEVGLPLMLGLISGVDPEAKDRFVKGLGMQYLGGLFAHNLAR